MKPQEAVELINKIAFSIKNEIEEIKAFQFITALKIAKQAIIKQIPQKVKYLNRHGKGGDLYNKDYFNCPFCGRRLRNKQKDNYCGRCGQLLDWEVQNETN